MDISIDYGKDMLIIDQKEIPLDRFREYLILWHQDLVQRFFVKAILINGRNRFSYDWQTIFNIAITNSLIMDEFVKGCS